MTSTQDSHFTMRGKPLYLAAWIMVFSGLLHLVVWLWEGGDWAGPLSWRKPILFGISTGVTAWSLGWILDQLPHRRGDRLIATLVASGLVVEVGLITLQTWRGIPSHFNRQTIEAAAVHLVLDIGVTLAVIMIADLTIRSFRCQGTPRDRWTAIRWGLLLLLTECLIGYAVLSLGTWRAAQGLNPSQFGTNGIPKFAHGVVIHAIQWLPLLSVSLQRCKTDERVRNRVIHFVGVSNLLLIGYACTQTLLGRNRTDVAPVSWPILAAALGMMLVAMSEILRQRRTATACSRGGLTDTLGSRQV